MIIYVRRIAAQEVEDRGLLHRSAVYSVWSGALHAPWPGRNMTNAGTGNRCVFGYTLIVLEAPQTLRVATVLRFLSSDVFNGSTLADLLCQSRDSPGRQLEDL